MSDTRLLRQIRSITNILNMIKLVGKPNETHPMGTGRVYMEWHPHKFTKLQSVMPNCDIGDSHTIACMFNIDDFAPQYRGKYQHLLA